MTWRKVDFDKESIIPSTSGPTTMYATLSQIPYLQVRQSSIPDGDCVQHSAAIRLTWAQRATFWCMTIIDTRSNWELVMNTKSFLVLINTSTQEWGIMKVETTCCSYPRQFVSTKPASSSIRTVYADSQYWPWALYAAYMFKISLPTW